MSIKSFSFFAYYFLQFLNSYLLSHGFLQKFICGGRLVFGPDARSLFVTLLLIIVPVIIFCVCVASHLRHEFSSYNSGYAILAVAILFTIHVSSVNFFFFCFV